MSARIMMFCLVLVIAPPAHAKNKKKQELPDYVLNAQTVLVVIHPDAGEPVTNPTANRRLCLNNGIAGATLPFRSSSRRMTAARQQSSASEQ